MIMVGAMRGLALVAAVWLLCSPASNAFKDDVSDLTDPDKKPKPTNPLRYKQPFNVCISDWSPFVSCLDLPAANYSGHQVELWRAIAKDLILPETTAWNFVCLDWDTMMEGLELSDGICAVGVAGIDVTPARILKGIKYSWPVYNNGLQVAISGRVHKLSAWFFFEAFDWPVWALLFASAVVVSILMTVVEIFLYGGFRKLKSTRAHCLGMRNWSWYIFSKLLYSQTFIGDPRRWASKVLVLGWGFLALIITHLYTATVTVKMYKDRQVPYIYGLKDLPYKNVVTWTDSVTRLRPYRVFANGMPWNGDADVQKMIDVLHEETTDALVLDAAVIRRFAWLAPGCDVYPVGNTFMKTDMAIAFPQDVPDDFAGNISASITRLQLENGLLDYLENKYISAPPNGDYRCAASVDVNARPQGTAPSLAFDELMGVWNVLFVTLGVAALITIYKVIKYRRKVFDPNTGNMTSAPGAAEPAGPMHETPVNSKDPVQELDDSAHHGGHNPAGSADDPPDVIAHLATGDDSAKLQDDDGITHAADEAPGQPPGLKFESVNGGEAVAPDASQ